MFYRFFPAYTYGDYVYFKYMNNTPNGDHNNFILNQIPYFHITSLLKLMYYIFQSLKNFFNDEMLKKIMD